MNEFIIMYTHLEELLYWNLCLYIVPIKLHGGPCGTLKDSSWHKSIDRLDPIFLSVQLINLRKLTRWINSLLPFGLVSKSTCRLKIVSIWVLNKIMDGEKVSKIFFWTVVVKLSACRSFPFIGTIHVHVLLTMWNLIHKYISHRRLSRYKVKQYQRVVWFLLYEYIFMESKKSLSL